MEALPATLEEASDGGLRAQRLEQLDEAHEGDAHAVGFEGLGPGTLRARQAFEENATLFYGVDGDRHVVNGAARIRNMTHRRMLHSAHLGDKERWNANE
jgi:hypothetical protein